MLAREAPANRLCVGDVGCGPRSVCSACTRREGSAVLLTGTRAHLLELTCPQASMLWIVQHCTEHANILIDRKNSLSPSNTYHQFDSRACFLSATNTHKRALLAHKLHQQRAKVCTLAQAWLLPSTTLPVASSLCGGVPKGHAAAKPDSTCD